MRILHIATRYLRRGGERKILHAAGVEQARGHEVHLAVGKEADPSQFPPNVVVHRIEDLVRRPGPRDAKALDALASLIDAHDFGVVHTHHAKAGILGRLASRSRGATIIHTIHGASFGPGFPWVLSNGFRAAERYCGRFTDFFIAVGHEVARFYLRNGIGTAEQYFVIRSPLEIKRFAAVRELDSKSRADARCQLALDPTRSTIVAVGALDANKRHGLIIDKLAPLLRTGEVQLAVAGEGRLACVLAQRAAARGVTQGVRFLGHCDRVDSLLAAADVLVHASRVEGVPQAVIQALAAGVPVVATRVHGLAEIDALPIAVLDPRAHGLVQAVRESLKSPPPAVDIQLLTEWTRRAVEMQLSTFYDALEGHVNQPSSSHRREHASPGVPQS